MWKWNGIGLEHEFCFEKGMFALAGNNLVYGGLLLYFRPVSFSCHSLTVKLLYN